MSKKKLRNQGIKLLLDNSDDEKMNEEHEEFCTPTSFITFFRGSEREGTPSSKWANLPDYAFFNSDIGREIILADQKAYEGELTLQNENLDCTGCSSWNNENYNNMTTISISKYMEGRSEPVGNLSTASHSVCRMNLKTVLGCNASTPETEGNTLSPLNKNIIEENDLSSTLKGNSECCSTVNNSSLGSTSLLTPRTEKTSDFEKVHAESLDLSTMVNENESILRSVGLPFSVSPPLLSLVTRKTENKSFLRKFYVGSANYRNIQRLRAEERNKANSEITDMSFDSLEINERTTSKSRFAEETSADFFSEMWHVEPQELLLDSTQGNRVILINNSDDILRFKSKCDGKIVNVCPLSGSVPAKSNIGLRIVISRRTKLSHEDIETDVKIIIGKTEKIIHVKVPYQEKSKKFQKRNYMLH